MYDLHVFAVVAAACEMMEHFAIADIRQLLPSFESIRFTRIMDAIFTNGDSTWLSLQGAEAATAVSLVAAIVEGGDHEELLQPIGTPKTLTRSPRVALQTPSPRTTSPCSSSDWGVPRR